MYSGHIQVIAVERFTVSTCNTCEHIHGGFLCSNPSRIGNIINPHRTDAMLVISKRQHFLHTSSLTTSTNRLDPSGWWTPTLIIHHGCTRRSRSLSRLAVASYVGQASRRKQPRSQPCQTRCRPHITFFYPRRIITDISALDCTHQIRTCHPALLL